MKKVVSIIIGICILVVLAGCAIISTISASNSTSTSSSTSISAANSTKNTDSSDAISIMTPVDSLIHVSTEVTEMANVTVTSYEFPEQDPSSRNTMTTYRNEVVSRLGNTDFLTEDEISLLKNFGYNIHGFWVSKYNNNYTVIDTFFYPVVFQYEGALVLWYTTEYGSLRFEKLAGSRTTFSNQGGTVHYYTPDDLVENTFAQVVVIEGNTLAEYRFGDMVKSVEFPRRASYCGKSDTEGYLFRVNDDVYAIDLSLESCKQIASEVEYVLCSDYAYSSDFRSQPLFLMEDGSVCAFISQSLYGEDPENLGHLFPLVFEGGYR